MKIRYQSRHGLPTAVVLSFVDAKDADLKTWKHGEVREIDDSRMVRFRTGLAPGAKVLTVKATDAIYDLGPDWVDPATGVNPDFACAVCGRETLDIEFYTASGARTPYRDAQGKPLCIKDYLIENPETLTQHIRYGMPTDLHDAIKEGIRAKNSAPKAAASTTASTPAQSPEASK